MSDGTVDFSDLANKEVSIRDLVDRFPKNPIENSDEIHKEIQKEIRKSNPDLLELNLQAVAHGLEGWKDKKGKGKELFWHILKYLHTKGLGGGTEWGRYIENNKKIEAIIKIREETNRTPLDGSYGGNLQIDSATTWLVPDLESLKKLDEKTYNEFADKIFIKFDTSIGGKGAEEKSGGEASVDSETPLNAKKVQNELKKHTNVIVEGVAGSGKSHLLTELRDLYPATPEGEPSLEVVVFHPSTSYEDFVSGLRPTTEGSFQGEAGIFVTLCDRAARHTDQDFLLFIDEINRANTSRVFGDLMLVLEKSKRASRADLEEGDQGALLARPTEKTIALQTPIDDDGDGEERKKYLQVPENLHVLGTMNTTDRSVGTIDLALRRRFHWMTMEPMSAPALEAEMRKKSSAHLDPDSLTALIEWYDQVNGKLLSEVGPDARLGHSYFFGTGKRIEDIAVDLLNQLKEVITTFSLSPSTIRSVIGDEGVPVGDQRWKIEVQGKGLGARPEIRKQNGSLSGASASA